MNLMRKWMEHQREHQKKFPMFLIVGMSWIPYALHLFNGPRYQQFMRKFPLRDLIAVIMSIPVYRDIDHIIWSEIERRFSPEEFDTLDQDVVVEITETVISMIYTDLDAQLGVNFYERYVFHKWIDPFSALLVHEDLLETIDTPKGPMSKADFMFNTTRERYRHEREPRLVVWPKHVGEMKSATREEMGPAGKLMTISISFADQP